MKLRITGIGVVVAAVVAGVALAMTGPAGAVQDVVIEFTVIRGELGEVNEIATEEVEEWLQGESCPVAITVDDNESVHIGTDILITSNGETLTVPNVETEPGSITVSEGELVFGETVTVSVRLGEDGVTSGGISVDFVCPSSRAERASVERGSVPAGSGPLRSTALGRPDVTSWRWPRGR